jgi:hypothetical protein
MPITYQCWYSSCTVVYGGDSKREMLPVVYHQQDWPPSFSFFSSRVHLIDKSIQLYMDSQAIDAPIPVGTSEGI